MKRLISLLTVISGITAVATATPINITVGGIADKAYYGSVVTPPTTNNPDDNLDFLQNEVAVWNGASNVPVLPSAPVDGTAPAAGNGSLGNITSYDALTGYDYVVFHFGAGNAGSPGGYWQAWYLAGSGGSFSLPTVDDETVGGFSSAQYWNPSTSVPDGGTTAVLLGLALVGMSFIARRRITT